MEAVPAVAVLAVSSPPPLFNVGDNIKYNDGESIYQYEITEVDSDGKGYSFVGQGKESIISFENAHRFIIKFKIKKFDIIVTLYFYPLIINSRNGFI